MQDHPTIEDIQDARPRIAPYIRHTQMLRADRIEPARGYPDHRERDDPDDHRVRGKTGVLGGDCHGQ